MVRAFRPVRPAHGTVLGRLDVLSCRPQSLCWSDLSSSHLGRDTFRQPMFRQFLPRRTVSTDRLPPSTSECDELDTTPFRSCRFLGGAGVALPTFLSWHP